MKFERKITDLKDADETFSDDVNAVGKTTHDFLTALGFFTDGAELKEVEDLVSIIYREAVLDAVLKHLIEIQTERLKTLKDLAEELVKDV